MDPLSALSIASAVLQTVDFAAKVISRAKEIHQSTNGALEENAFLEDAAANLSDLTKELEKNAPVLNKGKASGKKTSDEQLIELAKDSRYIADDLRQTLQRVKRKKDGGQRNALSQGLFSVLKQREISRLATRLDQMRGQVNTALLVTLRNNSIHHGSKESSAIEKPDHARSQKLELLASLQEHGYTSTDNGGLAQFNNALLSSIDVDLEERFAKMILARLYFTGLPDRHEAIPQAHQDTFQWVFETDTQDEGPSEWHSLSEWLTHTDGDRVFWIAGKPGSGKSTLMKYLFNNANTMTRLQLWTKDRPLYKAGFFFWNSGTVMQMSRMGLLQTLLRSVLKEDRSTLIQLFEDRWDKFIAFGGGRQPFTWAELREAFNKMVSAPMTPRSYFFMVDGLDEFDGEPKELCDLVLDIAKHNHVKVCVASRPWLVFSDAFDSHPRILVEQLTKTDIEKYVASAFNDNMHYARLKKLEPQWAATLINSICDKAAGVFLWVYLVVRSLLDGMSNADRMSDLIARLDALPPGLEQLFDKLLKGLDENYFKHACQIFRLLMTREQPLLLELWFADKEDHDSAMQDEVRMLSWEEITDRLETMSRRLVSRCKCFLEVESVPSKRNHPLWQGPYVRFIHRSARDFLQSSQMINTILTTTGHDAFDPERHWANAFMGILKAVPAKNIEKWDQFLWCAEYGLRLEKSSNCCPVSYLDEVGRAGMQVCSIFTTFHSVKLVEVDSTGKPPMFETFLEFAVGFSMLGYVSAKCTSVTRDELLRAAKFQDLVWREPSLQYAAEDKELLYIGQSARIRVMERILSNALEDKKGSRRARWKQKLFG